jgi:uncharacterized protein YecE (DUF72 family)
MTAFIGTSGWHYPHWRGTFYPADLPARHWLEYYAERFSCVELNNSFYKLPKLSTIANWVDSTPEGFVFAVKAPRLITHMKKLHDCTESLHRFLDTINGFGDRLSVLLFQLPPRWHENADRLGEFLSEVPRGYRLAFEFRDLSWYTAAVYEVLRDHNAACCEYDLEGRYQRAEITADFTYWRLHGPSEDAYSGSYSPQRLRGYANRLHTGLHAGTDAYVFFDNDEAGYAATNAQSLLRMLAKMQG